MTVAEPDTVDTGIAIIGSGAAGLMAAIHAHDTDPELDITLVSKGVVGRSGCSVMVSGFNAALSEDDSPELHLRDLVTGGAYINDQRLAWDLVTGAPAMVDELESYGCFFDRELDGRIRVAPFADQSLDRHVGRRTQTGLEIMSRLRDQMYRVRPRILEDTRALDLLLDADGAVAGIALLDINRGTPMILRAGAVIVATGGASTIYRVSSPAREKTGDGMAMCLRAGAELRDMEMMHFLSMGLAAAPSRLSGMLLSELFRRIGGHLTNAEGRRFMADYDPGEMESAPTVAVVRAAYREIVEGRGSPHDGVYLDVSHLGANLLEERFPELVARSRLAGGDLTTGPVEIAPVSHFHIGGVMIDGDSSTSIPGLFVAGEDAGGVHGAGWAGGNGIAEATIYGAKAGRRAAESAAVPDRVTIGPSQIDAVLERHMARLGDVRGRPPGEVAAQLKEVMWAGAGPVRDRSGLLAASDEIGSLNEQAQRIVVSGPREANLSWQTALDLENQLTVAEALLAAATIREESRGVHHRADHPDPDDAAWLRFTKVSMTHDEIAVDTAPVDLVRIRPEGKIGSP